MYYKIQDFIIDWKNESEATLKIFNNLTDESLSKKFYDNIRTPGRLAWHITGAIAEMMNRTGLVVDGPAQDAEIPESASEISNEYKYSSDSLVAAVAANWKDSDLTEKVNMYGQDWEKGTVLSILVVHQIHHRGQLTVLMRMAGLKVPGIYGPAQEEWAQFGMKAEE